MEEIWRDIENYEGLYQVSHQGRVRSLPREGNSGLRNVKRRMYGGKILKLYQRVKSKPYLAVTLSKDNKVKLIAVQTLVAIAFIPNPENKPQVNHKDGDPVNNHVDNLEWNTPLENTRHAHKTGLANSCIENNGNAKLTRQYIIDIRKKYATGLFNRFELAAEYKVSATHIWRIVTRRSSAHITL